MISLRFCIFLFSFLFVAGCVSTKIHWEPSSSDNNIDVLSQNYAELKNETQKSAYLSSAVALTEITYWNDVKKDAWDGRILANKKFSQMGYNTMYYHPKMGWFIRDPNLFILSKPHSHEVIIIYTGTELRHNPYDVIQNLKTKSYADVPNDTSRFLPLGHAGFRDSTINTIKRGFFRHLDNGIEGIRNHCSSAKVDSSIIFSKRDVSLADYICFYDVLDPKRSDDVSIVVIGHSLGAGIAQMSAGVIDGLKWNGNSVEKQESWAIKLKALLLFAPPLALYTRGVDEAGCNRSDYELSLKVYEKFYIPEKTVSVIKDGDMVPSLWNPISVIHCVRGEHFGERVKINRRGDKVTYEGFSGWQMKKPHSSLTYQKDLEKASK